MESISNFDFVVNTLRAQFLDPTPNPQMNSHRHNWIHRICQALILLLSSPDMCNVLLPQTQSFLKPWLCGTTGIPIQITPLGRSWNQFDGTMGTTANAMFLSSIYGQAIYNSPTPGYPAKGKRYVCWARVQVMIPSAASRDSALPSIHLVGCLDESDGMAYAWKQAIPKYAMHALHV